MFGRRKLRWRHSAAAVAMSVLVAAHAQVSRANDMPEGITVSQTAIGAVLVDAAGMTLYTFDEDGDGVSNCSGTCLKNWPALEAPAGAAPVGGFAPITRSDGSGQWAYNGRPLYLWVRDTAPGDTTGDGVRGWHAARP